MHSVGLVALVAGGRRALLRRYFSGFGVLLIFTLHVPTFAAEQPELIAKLDLTQTVGAFSQDSGIAFLTDDLLLISNAPSSPTLVLYDVPNKKIARTGTTCALSGKSVWATAGGKLLTACADGLVLYDSEFRQIANFQAPLSYYTVTDTLFPSPTREFIAFSPRPRQSAVKVLATTTLIEVDSFSPRSSLLDGDMYEMGYTSATYVKGKDGVEVSFYPFHGSHPVLLLKSKSEVPPFAVPIAM